jgi:hypothetical protein
MNAYKLLIFSNPLPGREDAFYRYYDTDLPAAIQMTECFGVQQFRAVGAIGSKIRAPFQHLVVAEWHAEDVDASWAQHIREERLEQMRNPEAFAEGVACGVIKEEVDAFDNPHWFFEALGPPITKE